MSWVFEQTNGRMSSGSVLFVGYAGAPGHVNDPGADDLKATGPLPRGRYTITPPVNHPHLGPMAMFLQPDSSNEMHGRGDFFIHADSIRNPGSGSQGCIVLSNQARKTVWDSGDHQLLVVRSTGSSWMDAGSRE